jgi:polysaccharide export outer membrane protein
MGRTWSRLLMKKRGTSMGKFIVVLCAALAVIGPAVAVPQNPQGTIPLQVNDYQIGPNDLLEITVYELPELNQTVRVSEDGSITLSLLGKVEVAKLTAQQLEKKLASLLDQQYTKAAHVTVFIREYQKVSVLGAVGRPGMYELVGPTTLLQAIAQAGGLTALAMKEIFVYRQGPDGQQTRLVVNIEDLMLNDQPGLNLELRPKDVVTVPMDQTCNVFVYGEVRTPGVVSFLGSKRITLLQAIAQAGGTTEWAKKSKVVIKRKDKKSGKEIVIHVNMRNMLNNKQTDLYLEEGDVVIVP